MSAIALLVLASVLVCNSAWAWDSRTLLSSELSTGVSMATGTGSGSGGASLNIGSFTSSGALNTGDLKESYSDAESYVGVEADYSDTESESYADAGVFQNDADLPQALGSVSSGATSEGSNFAGTGASAAVGVEEVYDQFGTGSYGVSTAFGDATGLAAGIGSQVASSVEASGASHNGDVDAKDIALSGGSASGHTSSQAEGDYIAVTQSEISLATASEVDPNAYDRENGYHSTGGGVAIIDAWSSAYGEESGSETVTMLDANAWANTADYNSGYTEAAVTDASAAAEAEYYDHSSGYGPGLSASGGSGILDVGVLVKADVYESSSTSGNGPVAVGVGATDAYVHAGGETYSVGKNTYSTGELSGYTSVDTGVTAVGSGQFSSTDDAAPAAQSSFHGVGTSSGTNGDDASVMIGALSFSDAYEVATSNGFSQSITDTSAETEITSFGEETISEATVMGGAESTTGGNTVKELSGTGGQSDFEAGAAANAQGISGEDSDEVNKGYSEADAAISAEAESVTATGENEYYTGGSSTATSGGFASGNLAFLDLTYDGVGESNGIAHSLNEGGLSSTATRGSQDQQVRIATESENGFTVGLGSTTVSAESLAASNTGSDYSQADSSTQVEADSDGSFYGDRVAGEGESGSLTFSATVIGSGAGEEEEEGYSMTGFGAGVGFSRGVGMANFGGLNFMYTADEGSNPDLLKLDFDGGSEAGSGAVAASETGFDGSLVESSTYIAADGYGSGYGDASVEYGSGVLYDAEGSSAQADTRGTGSALVGSGNVVLDMNNLVTITGLQATEAQGSGSGEGSGTADPTSSSPGYGGKNTYGLSAYASGTGSASNNGLVLGGAVDDTSFIYNQASGDSAGTSTAGVFTEGAEGGVVTFTSSAAEVEGGLGIGSVGNDPETIPSMAAGVAFDSSTMIGTQTGARKMEGEDSYAVSETQSAASGEGVIYNTPGASPAQIVDENENYAVSGGGALTQGFDVSSVGGNTDSNSNSRILEAGDETEFVQLVMVDEENTALTGGWSDPDGIMLGADFENEMMVESPAQGIAQSEVDAGAVGLATGIAAALGTDYDPSTGESPEVSGAFAGGNAFKFTLGGAKGTAVNVPGKDIQYEDQSGYAISAGTTPTIGLTVGAGSVETMSEVGGQVSSYIDTEAEDGNTFADVEASGSAMGEVIVAAEAGEEESNRASAFMTSTEAAVRAEVNSDSDEQHDGGDGNMCDDVPPPTSPYTCAEQSGWGKCGKAWMAGYCNASCGRCAGR
jgi:hypothetical protein